MFTFALRLALADERTYWLDEGFTLLRLPLGWAQIFNNFVPLQGTPTTDINPPIYFALLKIWGMAASNEEYALRLVSVFGMVLATPVTYLLGRTMFGWRSALLAALLATMSPAYQWYGWELRMYGLMPALAAFTMLALHRVFVHGALRYGPLIAWVVFTLLAVFTHYTFVSFVAGHGLFLLGSFLGLRARHNVRRVLLAVVGLVAAIAALAIFPGTSTVFNQMLRVLQTGRQSGMLEPASLWQLVQETLNATFFGMNAADPTDGIWQTAIGLIIAFAVFFAGGLPTRRARILLALCIALPMLFWIGLSFAIPNRPSFRYVIITLPAIHVALAFLTQWLWRMRAAAGLNKVASIVVALIIGSASTFGLAQSFVRTETWQDDWRGLARYIQRAWQPGDALLINIFVPETVLREYLGALPAPIVYVGDLLKAPPETGSASLSQNFGRVWYLNNRRHLENETLARLKSFALTQRVVFNGRTDALDLLLFSIRPVQVAQLPGAALAVTAPATPPGRPFVRGMQLSPGSAFADVPITTLSLFWQLDGVVEPDINVAARLHDADHEWMAWLIPADLPLRAGACKPSALCRVDYALALPPDLPAKPYTLELQAKSGAKQEVYQRTSTSLGAEIAACCLRKISAGIAPVTQFADAQVLRVETPASPTTGSTLPVVITWRPTVKIAEPWIATLRLEPLLGQSIALQTRIAGPADLAPASWPVNEPFRDPYQLEISPDTPPGFYRLILERGRNGTQLDTTQLAWLRLHQPQGSPVQRDIAKPVNARAGELALLGWGVDGEIKRGATLNFHTYWRVDRRPVGDGVIFLHAIREQGKPPVSQDDNAPARGMRNYRTGEGIDHIHRLTIHNDLPPGEYTLYAGIYERGSGERWPAELDGAPALDNLIKIGSFTLP